MLFSIEYFEVRLIILKDCLSTGWCTKKLYTLLKVNDIIWYEQFRSLIIIADFYLFYKVMLVSLHCTLHCKETKEIHT